MFRLSIRCQSTIINQEKQGGKPEIFAFLRAKNGKFFIWGERGGPFFEIFNLFMVKFSSGVM